MNDLSQRDLTEREALALDELLRSSEWSLIQQIAEKWSKEIMEDVFYPPNSISDLVTREQKLGAARALNDFFGFLKATIEDNIKPHDENINATE